MLSDIPDEFIIVERKINTNENLKALKRILIRKGWISNQTEDIEDIKTSSEVCFFEN